MRASIIRTLAAVALLAIPVAALAAPDQNTNGNQNQNGCYNGQWINGQSVSNNNGNGNWNNGRNNGNGNWNNNRNHHRDRDDQNDRDDQRNNDRSLSFIQSCIYIEWQRKTNFLELPLSYTTSHQNVINSN